MTGWRELVDGDLPGRYVDSRDAQLELLLEDEQLRQGPRQSSVTASHRTPARRHPPLYCSATKTATCHHAS